MGGDKLGKIGTEGHGTLDACLPEAVCESAPEGEYTPPETEVCLETADETAKPPQKPNGGTFSGIVKWFKPKEPEPVSVDLTTIDETNLAKALITLKELEMFRETFEEDGFSLEGLTGAKQFIESALGRPLQEGEWPEETSPEARAKMLELFANAEKILRGRIVSFVTTLVSPEDLIIGPDKDGDIDFVHKEMDTLFGVEWAYVESNGGRVRTVTINGKEMNFVRLCNELLKTTDAEEFAKKLNVAMTAANAASIASGIDTLMAQIDELQAGMKDIHGNILDNFAGAMGDKDGAPLQSSHPDYEKYEAENIRDQLVILANILRQAKAKLSAGDINRARELLLGAYNSKYLKQIPEMIGLQRTTDAAGKLKVTVSSIIIASALMEVSAAFIHPVLLDAFGTGRSGTLAIDVIESLAGATIFATTNTLAGVALTDETMPGAAAFGWEILSTAGMFKFIGSAIKVYKETVARSLYIMAAKRLVSRGAIKVEEIGTKAAQKLIAEEAKIGPLGKALEEGFGFTFEAGAFQSWEYVKANVEAAFGADIKPDMAFEMMTAAEGAKSLLAIKFGTHFIGKPLSEPLREAARKRLGKEFEKRLLRIEEQRMAVIKRIAKAAEASKKIDIDAELDLLDALGVERLGLLRDEYRLGLVQPEEVALAEAMLNAFRWHRATITSSADKSGSEKPEPAADNHDADYAKTRVATPRRAARAVAKPKPDESRPTTDPNDTPVTEALGITPNTPEGYMVEQTVSLDLPYTILMNLSGDHHFILWADSKGISYEIGLSMQTIKIKVQDMSAASTFLDPTRPPADKFAEEGVSISEGRTDEGVRTFVTVKGHEFALCFEELSSLKELVEHGGYKKVEVELPEEAKEIAQNMGRVEDIGDGKILLIIEPEANVPVLDTAKLPDADARTYTPRPPEDSVHGIEPNMRGADVPARPASREVRLPGDPAGREFGAPAPKRGGGDETGSISLTHPVAIATAKTREEAEKIMEGSFNKDPSREYGVSVTPDGVHHVTRGDETSIYPVEGGVLISHTHPSGAVIPSFKDIDAPLGVVNQISARTEDGAKISSSYVRIGDRAVAYYGPADGKSSKENVYDVILYAKKSDARSGNSVERAEFVQIPLETVRRLLERGKSGSVTLDVPTYRVDVYKSKSVISRQRDINRLRIDIKRGHDGKIKNIAIWRQWEDNSFEPQYLIVPEILEHIIKTTPAGQERKENWAGDNPQVTFKKGGEEHLWPNDKYYFTIGSDGLSDIQITGEKELGGQQIRLQRGYKEDGDYSISNINPVSVATLEQLDNEGKIIRTLKLHPSVKGGDTAIILRPGEHWRVRVGRTEIDIEIPSLDKRPTLSKSKPGIKTAEGFKAEEIDELKVIANGDKHNIIIRTIEGGEGEKDFDEVFIDGKEAFSLDPSGNATNLIYYDDSPEIKILRAIDGKFTYVAILKYADSIEGFPLQKGDKIVVGDITFEFDKISLTTRRENPSAAIQITTPLSDKRSFELNLLANFAKEEGYVEESRRLMASGRQYYYPQNGKDALLLLAKASQRHPDPNVRGYAIWLCNDLFKHDRGVYINKSHLRNIIEAAVSDPDIETARIAISLLRNIDPNIVEAAGRFVESHTAWGERGPAKDLRHYVNPEGQKAYIHVMNSLFSYYSHTPIDEWGDPATVSIDTFRPIQSLADYNTDPTLKKDIAGRKYKKLLNIIKRIGMDREKVLSEFLPASEEEMGNLLLIEFSSGRRYLAQGHHRFAALIMAVRNGDIPKDWLDNIPVRIARANESSYPENVAVNIITSGVELTWDDLFPTTQTTHDGTISSEVKPDPVYAISPDGKPVTFGRASSSGKTAPTHKIAEFDEDGNKIPTGERGSNLSRKQVTVSYNEKEESWAIENSGNRSVNEILVINDSTGEQIGTALANGQAAFVEPGKYRIIVKGLVIDTIPNGDAFSINGGSVLRDIVKSFEYPISEFVIEIPKKEEPTPDKRPTLTEGGYVPRRSEDAARAGNDGLPGLDEPVRGLSKGRSPDTEGRTPGMPPAKMTPGAPAPNGRPAQKGLKISLTGKSGLEGIEFTGIKTTESRTNSTGTVEKHVKVGDTTLIFKLTNGVCTLQVQGGEVYIQTGDNTADITIVESGKESPNELKYKEWTLADGDTIIVGRIKIPFNPKTEAITKLEGLMQSSHMRSIEDDTVYNKDTAEFKNKMRALVSEILELQRTGEVSQADIDHAYELVSKTGFKPEELGLHPSEALKQKMKADRVASALKSIAYWTHEGFSVRPSYVETILSEGRPEDLVKMIGAIRDKKLDVESLSAPLIQKLVDAAVSSGKNEMLPAVTQIIFRNKLYRHLPQAYIAKLAVEYAEPGEVAVALRNMDTASADVLMKKVRAEAPDMEIDIAKAFNGWFHIQANDISDNLRLILGNTEPEKIYKAITKAYDKAEKLTDVAERLGINITTGKTTFARALVECANYGIGFGDDGLILIGGIPDVYAKHRDKDLTTLQAIMDHVAEKDAWQKISDELSDMPANGLYRGGYAGGESLAVRAEADHVPKGVKEISLPKPKKGIWNNPIHGFTGYLPIKNTTGEVGGRLYVTIDPSRYSELAGIVTNALQNTMGSGIAAGKFFFKVYPYARDGRYATRRDHIVIYFDSANGKDVISAVSAEIAKLSRNDPAMFSEKGPYFTQKIREGLFFGEGPIVEGESFGSTRVKAMELASNEIVRLEAAGRTITPEDRARITAYFFEKLGLDPENPAFNKDGVNSFPYIISWTEGPTRRIP